MKYFFTVPIKNLIRDAVYRVSRFYKKYLENKIHVYDLQTIEIIKTLPSDAVCVDVGVNEGQLFKYIVQQCKNGKVYGFEPIPDLYRFLTKKYGSKRVELKQIALSDKNGKISFYYFPHRTGISGMSKRDFQGAQEIEVETRKLDDIFEGEKLNFIKIDVEGGEFNVLKGAYNTLNKFRPIVIFESGTGGLEYFNYTPQDIFDFFESIGYSLSTMHNYLLHRQPFGKEDFILNFTKTYDYQYIAYPAA